MLTEDEGRGTMYVLGAGASIGSMRLPKSKGWFLDRRMPSGENFFHDIFISDTIYGSTGTNFVNMLAPSYEGLNRLLHQTYKIDEKRSFYDAKTWKGVNIENVFTHLDIGSKMYSRGGSYQKIFEEGKKSLISFISIMLIMRSHGQYCGHLDRLFSGLSDRDTVASFNWDTIADVTLERIGKAHLTNYVDLVTKKNHLQDFYSRPLYLKLHGSLNWVTCRNKQCDGYGKNIFIWGSSGTISKLSLSDYPRCEKCNVVLDINIIPPQFEKIDIHKNNLYSRQWKLLRRKLSGTSRIVFIGYSFPPTDYYAEWLFRQINYLVEEVGSAPKFASFHIEVVNPEAYKPRSILRKRYNSIFRGHNLTYYNTLEEYVNVGRGSA